MDITKKYIKMCKHAVEIQTNERNSDEGFGIEVKSFYVLEDGYLIDSYDTVWNYTVKGYVRRSPKPFGCAVQKRPIEYQKGEIIWLPKQDQLQEMTAPEHLPDLLKQFHDFYKGNQDSWYEFVTMEQLWLAFVMCKKYNKIWDNKKEEWRENELDKKKID